MTTMASTFPSLFALAALMSACGTPENQSQPAPKPVVAAPAAAQKDQPRTGTPNTKMDFYDLKVNSLEGQPVDLSQYRGKVALVVNVASKCGYTPQYQGLEALAKAWQDRGVVVLGFPSNDFGGQEPGTPAEIREFCTSKYQVDFPLLEKVQTKAGDGQSPVYALLGKATGQLPNWNFCKYVVGKDGAVRQFFPSKTTPEGQELADALTAALQ